MCASGNVVARPYRVNVIVVFYLHNNTSVAPYIHFIAPIRISKVRFETLLIIEYSKPHRVEGFLLKKKITDCGFDWAKMVVIAEVFLRSWVFVCIEWTSIILRD